MSKPFDLFVFAGETSGDLHGAALLKEVKNIAPHLNVCGVGGKHMLPYLDRVIFRTEELCVMGFIYVLAAFPKIISRFFSLRKQILELQPKVLIFIDYAEFNLLMEKSLRKKGYKGKIIHYISPSVWAWRKNRIQTLANNVDHLLTIYPFEKEFYASTKLPVTYIGNPLTQTIIENPPSLEKSKHQPMNIGLFPGSRRKEIERNFPYMLRCIEHLIFIQPDIRFTLSIATQKVEENIYEYLLKNCPDEIRQKIEIKKPTVSKEYFSSLDFAIATSGTVNLELALYQVPTIVVFSIGKLDLIILKDILKIRLPHYCIVNIIANKRIFPELFGPNLTQETLNNISVSLLKDSEIRKKMRIGCIEVKNLLGKEDGSRKAAEITCSYFQ